MLQVYGVQYNVCMYIYIYVLYFTIAKYMCNILQHYETLHFARIHFTNVLCMVLRTDRHTVNSIGWRVGIMYKNCVLGQVGA